jgi:hypothetical protein
MGFSRYILVFTHEKKTQGFPDYWNGIIYTNIPGFFGGVIQGYHSMVMNDDMI